MNIDRYLWEAQAHANELLDLIDRDERENLFHWVDENWDVLHPHLQEPKPTVYVFLGENHAARDRRLAKLDVGNRHLLWLQARYLALKAANAAQIAVNVVELKETKYRKAVRELAQTVYKNQLPLCSETVAFYEFD